MLMGQGAGQHPVRRKGTAVPPAGLEQAGNEVLSLPLSPTRAHTPTRP